MGIVFVRIRSRSRVPRADGVEAMNDTRQKNCNWEIRPNPDNNYSIEAAQLAVLMDIRAELQALSRVMQCQNVWRGFKALAKIASRDERTFKRRVYNAVRKRIARKP